MSKQSQQNFFSCTEFGLCLAKLRQQKGVSARQMSLDIGQNKNYINSIEIGRNFPNMEHFFDICQYLCILPQDFFRTMTPATNTEYKLEKILANMPQSKFDHLYLIACDMQDISTDES